MNVKNTFKSYVDAYMKKHKVSLKTALKHKIVKFVLEMYQERDYEEQKEKIAAEENKNV